MKYTPIVIIGAPRSGTNMLRDVLTTLPNFGTWPCDEINYIWRHGNRNSPTDEFSPDMANLTVKKYIRNAFERICISQNINYVMEKTCANSLRVDFVDSIFPDAKYIFLIRDGRDVVSSAIKRWTAPLDIPYLLRKARYVPVSDLPYYVVKYFYIRLQRLYSKEKRLSSWGPKYTDMAEIVKNKSLPEVCAIQWAQCVKRAENSFLTIEPERVFRLRYEDFVSDPLQQLINIADFLNIKFEDSIMQNAVSLVSMKNVGKWKTDLDKTTLNSISSYLNPILIQYDYIKS